MNFSRNRFIDNFWMSLSYIFNVMKLTLNRNQQIPYHGYIYQATTIFPLLGQAHDANKTVPGNKVKNKKQWRIFSTILVIFSAYFIQLLISHVFLLSIIVATRFSVWIIVKIYLKFHLLFINSMRNVFAQILFTKNKHFLVTTVTSGLKEIICMF